MGENKRGMSSAIVVILLAAAGIIVAIIAIKFLLSAGQQTSDIAGAKMKDAFSTLNGSTNQ